jgi:hypothetical protein
LRILAAPALAFFLIASQQATAAEFIHAADPNRPDFIAIRGVINRGDIEKFLGIAWGLNKHATIILNSPGGSVDDAISIGEFVRSRNWDTLVQSNAVCNSACTMIWLAGTARSLGNKARLFHSASRGPRNPDSPQNRVRSEIGNAKMAEFMAAIGIPQELIDLQPKADPCCMNYVDYAQAQAWNLLSEQPAKQAPETQRATAATAPMAPKPTPQVQILATRPGPDLISEKPQYAIIWREGQPAPRALDSMTLFSPQRYSN